MDYGKSTPKAFDVYSFFDPLIKTMTFSGFLPKALDKSTGSCQKIFHRGLRMIVRLYLVLMWVWTIMMSINIVYKSVSESESFPWDGHANMVIKLLQETPYCFITVRNSVILTTFILQTDRILDGVYLSEKLRCELNHMGGSISMTTFRRRPFYYVFSAVIVVVLWEIYEWSCWFNPDIMGMYSEWAMTPFPFTLIQWQYAAIWWAFSSIPFVLSQLILCFPILFAYVIRKFIRFVNKELVLLSAMRSDSGHFAAENNHFIVAQLGRRIAELRDAHFRVSELLHALDKAFSTIMLAQFLFDVMVLFGLGGLLVQSKNAEPRETTMEWTFYAVSAALWMLFFLIQFSFPLIHMAEEAERTTHLVYKITFVSPQLFKDRFKDISMFLSETRTNVLAFTGGQFYYINRHYIVTCVALVASYMVVLTEMLDRFYGTEDLKKSLAELAKVVGNSTTSHSSLNH